MRVGRIKCRHERISTSYSNTKRTIGAGRLKDKSSLSSRRRYNHHVLYSAISSPSPSEDHHNKNQNQSHLKHAMGTTVPSSSSPLIQQRQKQKMTKVQKSILAILTATTLNLLGFTMTSPLTPTIGSHFSLPTGASFGSLTSAYPLGMLFGLFAWPRLSDNSSIGRKKIMAVSLFGSAVGLGLQCVCIWKMFSLRVFLIGRVLTGVFSGCGPVAKAYLADIGDDDNLKAEVIDDDETGKGKKATKSAGAGGNLAKFLAWRDAASTLAYILGPVVGGILFELFRSNTNTAAKAAAASQSEALAHVIGVSAMGSFLAAVLILLFVEDRKYSRNANGNVNKNAVGEAGEIDNQNAKGEEGKNQLQNDGYEIVACPLGMKLWTGVATVCVISFLYHVADSTFFAFFPALLQSQLQLNPKQIGLVFTMLSCITFCFSVTSMSSKLISKIGVVNTCALGLSAVGAGLVALSAAAGTAVSSFVGMPLLIVSAAALYFCGVPIYGPTVPTMLLQCVPPYQRGAVMGIDGIINTIARIGSPIIMGDIYRRVGASMAFGVAGLAVFCSSIIAIVRRFIVLRDQKKLASS